MYYLYFERLDATHNHRVGKVRSQCMRRRLGQPLHRNTQLLRGVTEEHCAGGKLFVQCATTFRALRYGFGKHHAGRSQSRCTNIRKSRSRLEEEGQNVGTNLWLYQHHSPPEVYLITFFFLISVCGRYVGIDPAGPCYTHPCTASENDRLDASDANYVQCIHSNIGYWGTIPRCGCEDFYLNSGVIQPGAFEPTSSHYYSVNIFEWTLNPKHKCYSTSGRQLLGVNSRGVCGVYKVKTLAGQPYC